MIDNSENTEYNIHGKQIDIIPDLHIQGIMYIIHIRKVVRGMNMMAFSSNGNVYMNCECVKGISFNDLQVWVKSALSPVIAVDFVLLRDNCAHFYRMECLLPHVSPA